MLFLDAKFTSTKRTVSEYSSVFFCIRLDNLYVRSVRYTQSSSNFRQYKLAVHTYGSSGADEGEETSTTYTIVPNSTFLDLKLLILNRTNVPLAHQMLETREQYSTGMAQDSSRIGNPGFWYPHSPKKLYLKGLKKP
jgi:hypothetical protein